MSSHWLFRDINNEFADGLASSVAEAAADLARSDAELPWVMNTTSASTSSPSS